jgi:pimeloyl-ACP methyl ester carboxylesterase
MFAWSLSHMKTKLYFIGLVIGLLSACSQSLKPDLEKLYKISHEAQQTPPPVVLVHGIMGSKLRDKNSLKELWFGHLSTLLFSNYKDFALDIDSKTLEPQAGNIEAFGIADKAAGTDYYRSIIDTLEDFGGYHLTSIDTKITDKQRHLYVFTYDWRQDNVKSAKQLDEFIQSIQQNYHNPQLKIDLVAHSMGGLVSRYYLRYGSVDVLDSNDFPVNLTGAKNVRKVILLGTPNLGSVGAVESFITGLKIGLRKIPTEVLATMPSVYQLFPHSLNTWLITIDGTPLERDVFDSDIWRDFQWSIYDPKVKMRILKQFDDPQAGNVYVETLKQYFHKQLERARRFAWSLTVAIDNPGYKIIVMGGDCSMTSARLLVEEVKGESITRLKPSDIKNPKPNTDYESLMLEPGDGTVTKASLLARAILDPTAPRHEYSFFPLDYPYFLCENHRTLTSNISFEDNLLNILLSH